MKINLRSSWVLLGGLFASCNQQQPPADASTALAPPPAATLAVPRPLPPTPPASAPPVRLPLVRQYEQFAAASDTLLRLPGQAYRVSWQVRLDTLRPLTRVTAADPAKHIPGDTSRGFQGYYTVEIRDSLGHRLGHRAFTKADFYAAVGPELAISSEVMVPQLLGYSAPLGGLLFTVPFSAPGTDWYGEAVLALSPSGQVRYLGPGTGSDGPEVAVALAADKHTLLTINEIRHDGRPPILLERAGAELRGAKLLNDTLALLVYELGRSRTRSDGMPYLDATPAQRHQPNAFVRDVRTGREVHRFRYDGFYFELGYTIPLQIVPPAQAVYLLDSGKGLYVLPLRQLATSRLLPFAALARSASSAAVGGASFELTGPVQRYRFIADTAQPTHVRYQLITD